LAGGEAGTAGKTIHLDLSCPHSGGCNVNSTIAGSARDHSFDLPKKPTRRRKKKFNGISLLTRKSGVHDRGARGESA